MTRAILLAAAALALAAPSSQAFTRGGTIPAGTAGWLEHGPCSGVLVTPTRVLTAAHCVGPVAGYVRLGKGPKASETIPVAGVTVEPHYANWANPRAPSDSTAEAGRYDVAILTLAHPARAKPLPVARHSARPGTVGYGYGFAKASTALRARQEVLPDARCRAAYPKGAFDFRATLCVGDPGPGARARICGGDSGGPLVAHGRLIGLVTFAAEVLFKRCGAGPALGGYADVGALSAFIRQPHPRFLPTFDQGAQVVRDGDVLHCAQPAFAPGATVDAIAYGWERRDLRTGHFAVRTLGGEHGADHALEPADSGTQIRCRQRIVTPGGPLYQVTAWLRVG